MTLRGVGLSVACILALVTVSPSGAQKTIDAKKIRMADPSIRQYMEQHLPARPTAPEPPNPRQRNMLRSLLKEGHTAEAERVAWILGDWKGEGNVSLLIQATDHPDASVRTQAAVSLGNLAPILPREKRSQAFAHLRQLVSGDDPAVTAAAIRSLSLLGTQSNSPASVIRPHIDSNHRAVCLSCVRALGRVGTPDDVDDLEPFLDDASVQMTAAAIRSIGKVGNPADAQLLVSLMNSTHRSVQVAAIRAVEALGAKSLKHKLAEQLNSPSASVRRSALKALMKMKSTDLSDRFIASTQDDSASVRLAATRAVGKLRIKHGTAALGERFADGNKYVRQAAVDSIVTIGTDAAIREAATALSSELGRARACASQALGRLQSPRKLQQHAKLLEDDYTPSRRWAAWALGEIGDSTVAPELYEAAFRKQQDTEVRAAAILSLGKLGYRRVLGKCHRLLPQKPTKDKPGVPTPVRVACARTMGFLNDRKGITLLAERIRDDGEKKMPDNEEVRAESAIALGRIGADGSVTELLQEHMTDEEEMRRVRVACQWAIEQITGSKPRPEIPPYPSPSPNYFARSLQTSGE